MEGYDRLTPQMAKYSDLAIFRKFSILNYRMLLYMQAQLVEKEALLISAIKDDQQSEDNERNRFAFDFRAMLNTQDDSDGAKRQRSIMGETFPILTKYSMCYTT